MRTNDEVTRRLFSVGLQLQATSQLVDDRTRLRLEDAITVLDCSIVALRHAIFAQDMGSSATADE